MNIRKIIRGILNENYPIGTEFDSRAPWRQKEFKYSIGINPETSEFKVMAIYPNELAIVKDSSGNNYAFYFGHLGKSDFSPYAEKEIVGAEKGWDEGDVDYEYSEDWEIDNGVIERYINDNISSMSKGEGVSGWEDGVDLVLVDDELKDEILNRYGSNQSIKKALI